MHFICIVHRFKVTKEQSLQFGTASHIFLDTKPGICRSIQQSYSNLPLFDVILQIYKFEVCIHMMAEPRERGSIHLSSKASWQLWLYSNRQSSIRLGLLM